MLQALPEIHRPLRRLSSSTPSDLSTDAWLALSDLSLSQPGGIPLSRVLRKSVNSRTVRGSPNPCYTIPDLISAVETDDRANPATIEAIANRLEAAHRDWRIFHKTGYQDLAATFTPGLHLVDLSTLDPGPNSLRNLTVSLLVSRLFSHAHTPQPAHAAHTPTLPHPSSSSSTKPTTLPTLPPSPPHPSNAGPAKAATMASASSSPPSAPPPSPPTPSPRPTSSSSQGKSRSGFFPLTLLADVKAVGNLASTHARDLAAILKGIRDPGQAIIVDDTAERAVVGHVIRR